MKLEKGKQYWINCRTNEERDRVLDVLDSLDYKWQSGQRANQYNRVYSVPMVMLLRRGDITQGSFLVNEQLQAYKNNGRGTICEASDFRNQWISLKKSLTSQ